MEALIPLFVAIPLIIAFLIVLLGKVIRSLHLWLAPITLLLLLIMSLCLFVPAGESTLSYNMGGWGVLNGIQIGIPLIMDGFSRIMLCIIGLIGTVALVYSLSYMRKYTSEHYFYSLFCLIIAGMNGVVLSGDLFNLFVFLEVSVMSSYALVAFGIGKTELEASFRYQVLGGLASMLILLAIGLIYWETRTLNIAGVKQCLEGSGNSSFLFFVQVLLLAGFGMKAAIVPFHAWLPDAHASAPSPISAMLSGVLIKAAGIYALARLFFNMFTLTEEMALVFTTLGTVSMVLGSLLALIQWDVKRMFAYSSISQIGYVIMAFGMGMLLMVRGEHEGAAMLAMGGGLFHLINHSVFKGLLFLNAGSLEHRLLTRDLKEIGAMHRAMPVTGTTSLVGSLSISGLPPFNGFFSKLVIIVAAVQGRFYLLAVLAILVSIITLGYFMKFQRFAFFNGKQSQRNGDIREVPFSMASGMVVLAALCLILSLLALPGIRETVFLPAVDILMDTGNSSFPLSGF